MLKFQKPTSKIKRRNLLLIHLVNIVEPRVSISNELITSTYIALKVTNKSLPTTTLRAYVKEKLLIIMSIFLISLSLQ